MKKAKNYLVLDGKRVDITKEQLEKLGYKIEEKDCFSKVDEGRPYYRIYEGSRVEFVENHNNSLDEERYNVANYCTDESVLQQRAYHEILTRLLWRFSMQNDSNKINWKDERQNKYYVSYSHTKKSFTINNCWQAQGLNVYFHEAKIAERAINEIILPFMEENPDFVW